MKDYKTMLSAVGKVKCWNSEMLCTKEQTVSSKQNCAAPYRSNLARVPISTNCFQIYSLAQWL